MANNSNRSAVPLLSIMMFLQFFTWGAWFATVGQALGANDMAASTGAAYDSAPLGAIFAPLGGLHGARVDTIAPGAILSPCGRLRVGLIGLAASSPATWHHLGPRQARERCGAR